MSGDELDVQIRALEEGHAFVDRSGWRKILVSGDAAGTWLNDLVTAGVGGLGEGQGARSMLLTPTGRIRADFHVAKTPDGFLLLQDPGYGPSVADILAPYVLSSAVTLRDRTDELALFCVPGAGAKAVGAVGVRPSTLGEGMDVLTPAEAAWKAETMLVKKNLMEASREAVEAWRIRRGIPRFGVDFGEDALPAEAGLEDHIDFTKGCFLGQESVAKVRNLGRPPRALLALRAEGTVAAGDRVREAGRDVGEVTSATPVLGGTALIARVRSEARDRDLSLQDGRALYPHRG